MKTIWLALLLFPLLQASAVNAFTQCFNGGTFNLVSWRCVCTPEFYGMYCETAFASSDPCANTSIPEIVDSSGIHGFGNAQQCPGRVNCIDFSRLLIGWYRIRSPQGGSLTSRCPDTTSVCGSGSPYIVTNIVQEANSNRRVYSAKLSKIVSSGPACYSTTDSYPVRILKCASYNLYFLGPTMSSYHHYCISDKKACAAGLVSPDGSGYEPCYHPSACLPKLKPGNAGVPLLQQVRIVKSEVYYDSYFNCTFQDVFETNFIQGLRYRVKYLLIFHNSTIITIAECTKDNLIATVNSTTTVSCLHEHLLKKHSNIYGGSLVCELQAKCNMNASDYISEKLVSAPHRFEFLYDLIDPTTQKKTSVIVPSQPIQICLNVSKVPTASSSSIEFRITARRQALIADDHIVIKVNSSLGNDTDHPCSIKVPPMHNEVTKVCTTLTLVNEDEDGLIIQGLNADEQVPIIEVNVSYKSCGDRGVYTGGRWIKLQSRQLTVNLTPLFTDELKDYLHVYSDPVFKPANSDHEYRYFVYNGQCRVLSLLRHKILPYEVQIRECSENQKICYVVELAIRYEYHLIRVFSKGGKFEYTATQLEKSALPVTSNNVPRGVTIESTKNGVRIKLDLYGTIIYTWGFVTTESGTRECLHSFIQNRRSMFEFNDSCPNSRRLDPRYGLDPQDLMVIPGFYDTPSRVDGIIYKKNLQSWQESDNITLGTERDMFSDRFVADRVSETLLKPTDTLNFCSCFEEDEDVPETYDASKRCAIVQNGNDYSRRKRSIPDPLLSSRNLAQHAESLAQSSGALNITEAMAKNHCADYVQSVLSTRYTIVSECSKAKGAIGELDFVTKFKMVCVQYATQLNVYDYTESLFNSFAGQCITSLSRNVSIVQSIETSKTLNEMLNETCPNNCSSNGLCVSGLCRCNNGYSGNACEVRPPSVVIVREEENKQSPGPDVTDGSSVVCAWTRCWSLFLLLQLLIRC